MSGTTSTASEQLFHLLRKPPTASFNQVGTKGSGLNKGDRQSMPQNRSIKQSESEEKRSVIQKEKRYLSTCETKKKLRSRAQGNRQTQSSSTSEEQSLSDEIQYENENFNTSNLPKKHTNSHLTPAFLVEKSQLKRLQIYTCFQCFLSNSQDCMWENSQQYLAHMSSLHKVFFDFEDILKSRIKYFSGSHIFFKGKLTSILSNTRYQGEFKLYYQLKNQMFSQLYFCSCKVPSLSTYRNNKGFFPIFNSERDYIAQLKKKPHQNQVLSHEVKQLGSKIFLKKNPDFDIDLQLDQIKKGQKLIQDVLKKRIKMISLHRLLQRIPMNILQIVSCNPGLIPPEKVSLQFPQCQGCFQLFANEFNLDKHHWKVCKMAKDLKKFEVSQNDLLKLGQFRKKQCRPIINNLFQLTENQYLVLDTQLSLLKSIKINGRWKSFICGHCLTSFNGQTDPYFDFLLHVYLGHQTLHPLNSHYITFIQKLPREMQESDQEEED